jgi:hypothetical protein
MKTETVRILESLAIPHTIRRFRAKDLSAEEAAWALDVPLDRVDLIRAAAAVAADLSENT